MSDPIQTICSLTGCSEAEANQAYDRSEDVVDAVDLLLAKVKTIALPKRLREITQEEEIIAPIRKIMKRFDESMSTDSSRHGYDGLVEKLDLPEEKARRNNCDQECQPFSHQIKVQKQETVCQSLSECFSDLQLTGQTLPCSGQECFQANLLQGTESSNKDEKTIDGVPLHEQFQDLPTTTDSANQ
jgi:hypothetical protein